MTLLASIMAITNNTTDLQSNGHIPVTQTRCNASEGTGNVNNSVANSTRSFESTIQTINRMVTGDPDAAHIQSSAENTSAMQHLPADASKNQAPVHYIDVQSDKEGEETASCLTPQMADSDPSVSKGTDEGPMKSTAGMAFKENESGVRFSVPAIKSDTSQKT